MSDLRIRTIDESELDTVLGEDVEFDGEMSFQTPILIKGHVQGTIDAESDLFVSSNATVQAEVRARVVSVKGRIHGNVAANSRLELFSGSRIDGKINSPEIIMQRGAVFNGTCRMDAAPE